MNRMAIVFLITIYGVMTGCAHQVELSKQEKFLAAAPRSILIVPVVNNSVDVAAAEYVLSTLSIPLAEHGYYVFPVNMVKRVLEDDGLADASLVHSAPTSRLAALFGADSVLYVTVNQWNAKYMLLNTQVNVELDYKIRDAKTDDLLWSYQQRMIYNSNNGGGGGGGLAGLIAQLIVEAVHAAITKGVPNYLPLANQANTLALLSYPGNGIPPGPYATEQRELSPKANQ
jgi:hypothetical protein